MHVLTYFLYICRFATHDKNALLFYNGRYNEKHDFVALEIMDGQVQFSYSLGSEVTRVSATVDGGVHDGEWHQVELRYYNKVRSPAGKHCNIHVHVLLTRNCHLITSHRKAYIVNCINFQIKGTLRINTDPIWRHVCLKYLSAL